MSKLGVEISVKVVWLEEPTDLRICEVCGDRIYGKMLRLWVMPKQGKVSLIGHKTDMVLCESCFGLIGND